MDKKLFHPSICPVCRGEACHRWKLLEIFLWFLIVAVALWIIVELIGAAAIAIIAVRGPTWGQ